MSVIIRLQNLPWSANAQDIREFFKGLAIPEGGVHIVGGERGDAFIAFSSDEDARLAMQKTGSSLKGIQIALLLSSRSEMQKVIEAARQQVIGLQTYIPPAPNASPAASQTTPSSQQSHYPQPPPTSSSVQNQVSRPQMDETAHQNPPNPNFMFQERVPQPYGQSFGSQFLPNQVGFQGQRMTGYPPGVVPPGGMANQFFGQPPPLNASPTIGLASRMPSVEGAMPSGVPQPLAQVPVGQPNHGYMMASSQASLASQQPSVEPQGDRASSADRSRERKSVSSSSSAAPGRDKRDRESRSRDERRRHSSKSRSKSRERDRRRRHRSRSRSRSRDRSSRRPKRSRSRDRDRARDKERERQRDRDKDKDKGRAYRRSQEAQPEAKPKPVAADTAGLIPGLGDIPDDIPKEGLSLFSTPPNNPLQSKEPLTTSASWARKDPAPADPKPTQPLDPQPASKAYLLSTPPAGGAFGGPPAAPLLSNPPGPSAFQDEGPYPNPSAREGLLPFPKGRGSPGEARGRDWADAAAPFDPRKAKAKEEERLYRGGFREWGRGAEWERAKEAKADALEDWGRSRREGGGEFDFPRGRGEAGPESWGPVQDAGRRDRREQAYPSRGGRGFQEDLGGHTDYDDRFGRGGGFRGRGGRRGVGAFGRDPEREMGSPRTGFRGGGGGGGGGDGSPYRDNYSGASEFESSRGGRGGRGFARGRGGRVSATPGDYSRDRKPAKTCSVEILNVPPMASYKNIRDLFTGIPVPNGSIKILCNQQGNKIGVALIQFSSTRDAYEGFKRSGGYIFDSRVQVNFIDDGFYLESKDISEFEDLRNAYNSLNTSGSLESSTAVNSPCLYVSGLPIGCTDHDVARVFEQFKVEDVVLEMEKGSRQPSGGCFISFVSNEEAKNALAKMVNANIDGTPIKVKSCSTEAMQIAIKEREKIINFSKQKSHSNSESNYNPPEIGTTEHLKAIAEKKNRSKDNNCKDIQMSQPIPQKPGADLLTDSVVVRNVPDDINETNIRDFFSDEGLIPEKVYFNQLNDEGKCDVFVVFPKISEAKRALDKNAQHLGSTKVVVELISKPTVSMAMGVTFNPLELFQKGQQEGGVIPQVSQDNTRPQAMEIDDDFQMMNEPNVPQNFPRYRGGRGSRFPRMSDTSSYGGSGYRPRHPMAFRKDHDGNYPQDKVQFEERIPMPNGREIIKTADPPENFGKPGCVVALANVPYQATTEDILAFFREFDGLQSENIIRRYDQRNRPTSDSRVSLSSQEEARRAIETLNRKYMLGRPIFVSLVQ